MIFVHTCTVMLGNRCACVHIGARWEVRSTPEGYFTYTDVFEKRMTEHDILTDAERAALQEVMQASELFSPCVLIVDDDPLTRDLLAEFLELNAIECLKACNEEQALALLASGKPVHLMLTDLRMQPYDGLHLIRKVRESERAALPIIIMSGDASVRDAIDAMHLSVVDFLLKPIDTDKLLVLVRKELNI